MAKAFGLKPNYANYKNTVRDATMTAPIGERCAIHPEDGHQHGHRLESSAFLMPLAPKDSTDDGHVNLTREQGILVALFGGPSETSREREVSLHCDAGANVHVIRRH